MLKKVQFILPAPLISIIFPYQHTTKVTQCSAEAKCAFGFKLKSQLILPFSLFLLLFMGPNCTVLTNFYLYLQYFQQKVFNFGKINGSQIDPTSTSYIQLNKIVLIFFGQTPKFF